MAIEEREARLQEALDAMRGGVRAIVEGEDEVIRALLTKASDEELGELERLWRLGGLGWPTASKVTALLAEISARRAAEEAPARPIGVFEAIGDWMWRRWLTLVGIVSGVLAGLLDLWNGFQVGRRIVAAIATLLAQIVR